MTDDETFVLGISMIILLDEGKNYCNVQKHKIGAGEMNTFWFAAENNSTFWLTSHIKFYRALKNLLKLFPEKESII